MSNDSPARPSPATLPSFAITGMTYNHTQYGRLHYLFLVFSLAMLVAVWLTRRELGAWLGHRELAVLNLVLAIAAIFAFCGLVFGTLTIGDEGEWLAIRFGPLPVLRKTIRYADITGVEIGRTKFIDGWGIHYCLGRGWTYNVWGFDCVKLTLGRKIIRVGTDDAENLAKCLHERTGINGKSE
ncbi:MAG: hypothetical protein ACLP9L_22845 [Thermoguttaceae bacterium]